MCVERERGREGGREGQGSDVREEGEREERNLCRRCGCCCSRYCVARIIVVLSTTKINNITSFVIITAHVATVTVGDVVVVTAVVVVAVVDNDSRSR